MESLLKQSDIITFNNIKSFLIFFINYSSQDKEYKKLVVLKNKSSLFSNQNPKDYLKRYDLFKSKDFYHKLKKKFRLKNPINKNGNNPNNLNTIKDIFGYYVITPDNLLIVLLILFSI